MKNDPLDIALLITIESILSFLIFILWLSKFLHSFLFFQVSLSLIPTLQRKPFTQTVSNNVHKPSTRAYDSHHARVSIIKHMPKSIPKIADFLRFQTIDRLSLIIATPSANTLYLSQPGTRSGFSLKKQ